MILILYDTNVLLFNMTCHVTFFLFGCQPVFGCKCVQRDHKASVPFRVVKNMGIPWGPLVDTLELSNFMPAIIFFIPAAAILRDIL